MVVVRFECPRSFGTLRTFARARHSAVPRHDDAYGVRGEESPGRDFSYQPAEIERIRARLKKVCGTPT
jgi:hypothetical protein